MFVLRKIKRPQGTFSFEYESSDVDRFGHRLSLPTGSRWFAPHDHGALAFDVIILVTPGSPLVTWWCDDPNDRRIEIDMALPPMELEDGWSFTDLELDVILHADGSLVVEDEDEFAEARDDGHIDDADAVIAEEACARAVAALRLRREPFGQSGWTRLEQLKSRSQL